MHEVIIYAGLLVFAAIIMVGLTSFALLFAHFGLAAIATFVVGVTTHRFGVDPLAAIATSGLTFMLARQMTLITLGQVRGLMRTIGPLSF